MSRIDPINNDSALLSYWQVLKARKYTLLTLTAAAGLIGYITCQLQVPLYRAQSLVETIKPGGTLSIRSNWDVPTRSSAWQMRRSIRKRALLEKVSDELKASYKGRPLQGNSAVRNLFRQPQPSLQEAVTTAEGSLRIRETDAPGIIEVLCDSTDPGVAADFSNALIAAYVDEDLQQQSSGAQSDRAKLREQLEKLAVNIRIKGAQLQQYARESVLLSNSKEGLAADRTQQLRSSVEKAQKNRELVERNYRLASALDRSALNTLPEGDDVSILEQQLADLDIERFNLLQDYTPAHPRVRLLEGQIEDLEQKLDKARDSLLGRLGNEYSAALKVEKTQSNSLDTQTAFVTNHLDFSAAHQSLQEELDQDLNAYANLLKDFGLNTVISAVRSPKLRVLDTAERAKTPHSPVLAREVGNALINGFSLILGYLLLRAGINRTFRVPGDVARLLGVAELAAVPAAARRLKGAESEDLRRLGAFADCAESGLVGTVPGTVIMVTSPRGGDGKTSIVANLGIAMAEAGRKVLLIDADVKSPHLHEHFGVSNDRNFLHALGELGGLNRETVRQYARPVSTPNLYLLPGGRGREKMSHLLFDRATIEAALHQLRSEFDLILVEAPSVFLLNSACGIFYTDVRVLGGVVDGSILVLKSGHSTEAGAESAIRHLRRHSRFMGVILNDCPPNAIRPGAGAYYYGSQRELNA